MSNKRNNNDMQYAIIKKPKTDKTDNHTYIKVSTNNTIPQRLEPLVFNL